MTVLVTWTPYNIGARDADLIADPFAGITSNGTIVGADPFATSDGDGSYVEVTNQTQGTSFQLSPDQSPTGTLLELWWEATYKVTGPPSFGADYSIWVNGPTIRGTFGDENAPVSPTTYTDVEWFHLTPAYNTDAARMLQAALDQPESIFGLKGPAGATARVTFLRMFSLHEGSYPMRVMQRGDGLGMGSGRVYATGTRQASTRVFGTY